MEEKSKVAKPVLRKSMHGEIQTIVVYYKKLFMKKFKQFFTFKSMDSLMRNTNFEKFEPVL